MEVSERNDEELTLSASGPFFMLRPARGKWPAFLGTCPIWPKLFVTSFVDSPESPSPRRFFVGLRWPDYVWLAYVRAIVHFVLEGLASLRLPSQPSEFVLPTRRGTCSV